jgi:hypothetical protein
VEKQIAERNRADEATRARRIDRSVAAALILSVAGFAGLAAAILFREGNAWVLIAAILVGAALVFAERIAPRPVRATAVADDALPRALLVISLSAIAIFIVCVPTLHSYFSGDEFAYIPLFQNLSFGQFLHLFHSDLSQGVLGWSPHELRPLYGLSFHLSYRLWGLHPLGYHLTSIALHTFNAALIFLIVKKIGPGNSWRAGFAALLFSMQPIHSWTISWANGSLTETVPSLFYILAFFGFVTYRASGSVRYFALSVAAFAACLFSKETSVTLPIMLVSYDLFLFVMQKIEPSDSDGHLGGRSWFRSLAEYLPYAVLLIVYLELRRVAFTSYLLEDKWGTHLNAAAASPAGFWLHFRHLILHIVNIESFNVRHLMLWLPMPEVAVMLGVYLCWLAGLFRHGAHYRRSITLIFYFGFVWYGITNLPLLASYNDAHHLYLPCIGPCIAAAFLAEPIGEGIRERPSAVRIVGAALIVLFCAIQLDKEDVLWARKAEVTEKGTSQVAAALSNLSKPAVVVISFPEPLSPTETWDEDLPYSLQPPFQPSDLYSRAFVIEYPDIYCCPLDHWWPKTKSLLENSFAASPDDTIELDRFLWDSGTTSFRVERRVVPRESIRREAEQALGAPINRMESVERPQAIKLVSDLGQLATRTSVQGR